jgi:hypothetical protein
MPDLTGSSPNKSLPTSIGYFHQVTAAQRGMSLQMAFSLKKMTSRMAKIRQERRSPVTEAYYNGNYQVRLYSQEGRS